MDIVARAKNILLDPKGTWPAIDAEAATPKSIYVPYVVALAALAALCSFIGLSLVGIGGFGVHFRVPFVAGLVNAVVGFALSLVMVFVMSLIVDALAPTFGGRKDSTSALKLVAYGSTAGFLGGVFSLMPSLAMLGLLAALYSIYLIYTGLPTLMKCPPEKAVTYCVVVVIAGIVLGVVASALTAVVSPRHPGFGMAGMGGGDAGEVSISTPKGDVKIDTKGLEAMARRMEEAGKQMEAAQAKGDTAAAGQAAAAAIGALTGGSARTPAPSADLKALLPDTLAGLKRESFEAQSGAAMGIQTSSASAIYREAGKRVELSVTDTGGLAGVMAFAGWAHMTMDRETDGRIERVYKQGARTVREEYRKDGSRGDYTVVLANGVLVEAKGNVAQGVLKSAAEGVDLAKLESLK